MYVLPTERQILPNNTTITLNGTEYKILDTKGRGASCVVYLAENCTNKRIVLIKELYPINLGIFRDKENNLIVPNSFCEHFKFYKHKLCEAYKLQLEFHNSDETGNYTSDAETMVEAYSTLYVIMNKVVGSSYDKVVPENITDVLEVCKSVATVIGFYHKKGYLHLDIKPDNIYVLKETNQIINLFDFDTVKLKSDLENGNYIASTNKISAPEISKAEIDEFTGKYLQEVDERADIYAIGHILFEKVMERDAKSSDIILGKKFNLEKTKLLKNSSPQLREKIQEIFQHTVVRMKSERYSNTDELIKALDQALEIATEEKDGYLIDNNITVTTSSSYYISRKDKLSEIRQHLENYHIAYLYGIGGIGKSETAREYAEEYRGSYTTIQLSVYSGDLKSLIAGLKFSSDDNYFEKDINIRYETKLSLLSKAMINNERTLLIIDNYNVEPDSDEYKRNVEVMKDLKKLHIHILFTTRTSPNDDKTKIDIEELSKEELRHMFFAINPKDKDKEERIAQVDELIETAYRHTLTVDLVAHQTAKIEGYGKKTLSDYIKVLKESGINSGINVAVYNNKDDNEKSDIIFEHIRALFNLTALSEKEKYIMVNACLLPLSGMSVAEFESFIDLENYPNSESNDGWSEDSTISNLVKSGWIKRIDGEVPKITLHPIVSEVTVNELKPEITEDKCKNFFDSVSELIDKNDLKTLEAYKDIFISSADALLKNEDEISVGYVSDIASLLDDLAYYPESLYYYMKVLKIRKKVLPENHPDIATSYNDMGLAYGALGEYKKELECCLKALAIQEKVLPENYPDIATLYNNVGYAYGKLEDHKKQLEYYLKALAIREKVLPENHPDIVASYNNVGYAYGELADHKKELNYYLKVLAIQEKVLPENHPDIAASYNDVGSVCSELGDHKKELDYYLKALAIREKVLPENHPDIAASYNNIGCAYGELGEHKNELEYCLKALAIQEKVLPENHPDIATSYDNVGYAYGELGEHKKELEYKLKALAIREKVLPENHPDIAASYNNIGCSYGELGNHKKQLEYYLKAVAIQEKVLPENHPGIAASYNNVGGAYGELGDHQKELEYKLKALAIREKVLPENHPDIATSYNNVGFAYGKLEDHKKELEYQLKALSIIEKVLPENHPDIAALYNNVGFAYGNLGDHQKELEYYLKSLAIQEKVLPENHPSIATSYSNLGVVYMDLKEYKKALQYLLLATPIFEQTVPKNNAQLARLYSRISKAYANLGDEENLEKYLKLYQQYNDQ
ncbi:protein kinase family protein [Ruminococcus sp.]|uniref:protein kinase family protein n=2 Tax=Ruminococcus sp. TaxID=41978 RepID=UPI003AB7F762